MKRTILTTLLGLLTLTAVAQDPEAQRAAIEKLAFLEGDWSGTAIATLPDGSRIEMAQTERVSRKVGGLAITFEGTGRDRSTGEVAFEAFASVFQDFQTGEYRMYGGTSDGRNGEMELRLVENGVQWWPKGMEESVRYTITVSDDGQWVENGEYSMDGQTWMSFFQMTLTRNETAGAP